MSFDSPSTHTENIEVSPSTLTGSIEVFPSTLTGNIEGRGEQKSLFPLGPVILKGLRNLTVRHIAF